jgi:hypothetical protein
VTRDKVYTTVLQWFRDKATANLVLPDGAYEYSDFLQLTYITSRPRKLLMELNGQFMLVITDPTSAIIAGNALIISGFAQVLFDWQEGSDPTARAKVFKYGEVKFMPAGPGPVPQSTPKDRELNSFT